MIMMNMNNVRFNNEELLGMTKVWRAALYVRLSREDGDKEESNSVSNQKELLHQFAGLEPDIQTYDEYVDDGWSGTNFDRPNFIRMMNDIKIGLVNCVIVKDLSRFGRNYIEAGQYLEKLFPLMDVRFISITDNLDSYKNPNSMNNIMVPFKNLINDEYCRDISNKVRSSLDMKRKQGKHIGSFALYGYKKDPEDKNHLVIDEEAAEVVRTVYKWFISGMSMMAITKKLNEQEIPCPSVYKRMNGLKYKNPYEKAYSAKWQDTAIRRMLTNQMYLGDLVQGTMKVKSYKVQVNQRQAEKDWIIVPDTHEPIISREDFALVQELLKRRARKAPEKQILYWYSGYVKCGDCLNSMRRKEHKHDYGYYVYLKCTTYTRIDKNICTKHTIRLDKLEEMVLSAIQSQVALAVDIDQAIQIINSNDNVNKETIKLNKMLIKAKEEIEKVESLILDLYPDWKAGMISKDEYMKLKQKFDEQKSKANKKVSDLEKQIEEAKNGQDSTNQFLENFLKFKNITELTREVMAALIDMIYIYEDNKIKIVFKYQDPFKFAMEYIENNKKYLEKEQVKILLGA